MRLRFQAPYNKVLGIRVVIVIVVQGWGTYMTVGCLDSYGTFSL